jgi:hypothetical protein
MWKNGCLNKRKAPTCEYVANSNMLGAHTAQTVELLGPRRSLVRCYIATATWIPSHAVFITYVSKEWYNTPVTVIVIFKAAAP